MMLFNAPCFACLIVLLAATSLKSSYGFHVHQQRSYYLSTKSSASLSLTREHQDASASADADGDTATTTTATTSRRDLLSRIGTTATAVVASSLFVADRQPALAFDGSGASASAGYSPATKAEKKKKFKERIVADVKDFNVLGQAINDRDETKGPDWVNFFITFQRREPDDVGRTYAGLVDLRGLPTKKSNEFEGGDGLLLANTFTKAGKPPDNTPAVKSFLKLSKTFDAIEDAGKAGDAAKAKKAWLKTSELLSQYLADVELPGDLKDPLYKP